MKGSTMTTPFGSKLLSRVGVRVFCSAALATCLLSGSVLAQGASTNGAAHAQAKGAKANKATTVAFIELQGSLGERVRSVGLGGIAQGTTLRDVLDAINLAATDADYAGLAIRLKDAELTQTNVEELGAAIKGVRDAGKKVFLYAEGYDNASLALGSFCDQVYLQQGGEVSLPGIYMEEMFLADTFKWVGITPDFVQIGDYKGAQEMFANSKPSPQWDQNINSLLDGIYGNLRSKLKSGRGLSDAQLDSAMERAWMASGEQAIKDRLIDAQVDLPDLDTMIGKALGTSPVDFDSDILPDSKAKLEEMAANPFTLFSNLLKTPTHTPKRDTLAVLHIDGAIVDGNSTGGGLFGGEGSVGSRTIRRALGEIEENDKIKGVVIRINSPGGSAIASEIIWQGVRRVAAKKPVWVSIGGMAASGGYYIAVSGDKIYVNPSSIVGSIGVVGGKMALEGAYSKLHMNVVSRSRGPRAGVFGSVSPWSEADRALVRSKMTETYDLFTKRVSAGRKGIDLSKTAEGRIFAGNQAIDLKMADNIGGIEVALGDLAQTLTLKDGQYDIMDYPAPKTFQEVMENLFNGGGMSGRAPVGQMPMVGGPLAEMGALAKTFIGEANFRQVSASAQALMQMQKEPVVLVSPSVLIFK